MIERRMRALSAIAAVLAVLALSACGFREDTIDVPKNAGTVRSGAVLFKQRCAGCHTFNTAGTHGSAANVRTRERNDGPNFSVRCEDKDRVLYAIRNGGFSGAIMPQNIVVGREADAVAQFVAKYSGGKAKAAGNPEGQGPRPTGRGSTPPQNQPAGGQCGAKIGGGKSSIGG
jgi:mono/diheme cytochrome c family protein